VTAAVELQGLEKTYRTGMMRKPVAAIRGISLRIAEGEAFGFVGPNGAGKSTTIRIIMGLSWPTSGSATLFDVDVRDARARMRIGYVPENPYLYDYLTPDEILEMGMQLHRVRLTDAAGHRRRWLERLGLAEVAGAAIRSFSKGMTQRVAIAHALCIEPRLLVLDEPLSGLDPLGRRDVVDILSEYKKSGGTLFFTSHVLHDVERLADRFGLIHEGCIRSVSSPNELVGNEELHLVRSRGSTPAAGMREESAGRWAGEVTHAQLWAKLAELRAAGHEIIEVRASLSLEAAFLRVTGHGTSVGAIGMTDPTGLHVDA